MFILIAILITWTRRCQWNLFTLLLCLLCYSASPYHIRTRRLFWAIMTSKTLVSGNWCAFLVTNMVDSGTFAAIVFYFSRKINLWSKRMWNLGKYRKHRRVWRQCCENNCSWFVTPNKQFREITSERDILPNYTETWRKWNEVVVKEVCKI